MKIGTRLLLGFVLVSVLPLALFSYFNLKQDEQTLRAEALSRVSDQADKKVQQVTSYLAERVQNVRLLAQSSRTEDEISALRKAYALRKADAASYARIDALLRTYFARYVEANKVFYDVFLIDPQGEIIYTQKHESDFATNLFSETNRNSKFSKAFSLARMTLEPVISEYEMHGPSQVPALFIVAPIMVNGKLTGMFAAQLSNELIYRVARDATGLGISGEAAFGQMDGGGVRFTTPLKYQPDAAMNYHLSSQKLKLIPMFGALSGDSGAGVIADYRGKEVVAAWRYLPELNWGVVVKIDANEEFATIYAQRSLMLEVLLGIFLFSSLLAYYFGRQMSTALSDITQVSDEVAQGSLDKRADESAPGEFGLLAYAFNRMTVKLQTSYRTLEERIVERTEQLSVSNEQLQDEIVEREHIEIELREKQLESERKQDLLNEAQRLGKLGSWELNLVTGELHWSDEIYRMFELDPAQFQATYENFLNVIHSDDRDKVKQAYSQSLQDRQPYDVLHRLLFTDGRIKWVHEHCSSNFDDSGKPLRSVGAVQDVTEQRLTEENLRIAAVAFETHEAIMITDEDANIVRVNQAFEDITGYRSEEILGKNPRILSSGRQDKAFYADLWAQLLSSGTWSGEIWDKRKNGQIYPKWLTITAVNDSFGNASEYVAIFSDITARKQAEEEIRNLAFYDALTKLPNRRLLLNRFHLALSASERNSRCGALLFLDMDKFKLLNDTLGHDYGDLMLIEVARRAQACVRDLDMVARLGGDEFVVLLEGLSESMEESSKKTAVIAEKLRVALSQPYFLKDHEHHSSPSIGVSIYLGSAETVEELMKQADMAMYQAKDSGRNTVRFFDPEMQHSIEERAELEADLRRALSNNQLQLYCQIQVDGERRPIGAEALIRWQHPVRGMISPAQFIPMAEESSLIVEIGAWVIECACEWLAKWADDEHLCHLKLAVNVSAQQFRLYDFVSQLEECIVRHDIKPSLLKLELTESVVLNDVSDVVSKMHAIKALGVRLSLDDFGTGYSSLAYLKLLPLDQIKIDQSFVRDVTTDPNDAVMVKTIIDMAQNFRLNVIAEGVETEAQFIFLKRNQCMAYQGYLFSKPVPVADFELLAKHEFEEGGNDSVVSRI